MIEEICLTRIFDTLGCFRYEVPVYQRGYAWEKKHVEDFWTDLQAAPRSSEETHFYGNIYTTSDPDDSKKIIIVDGQQRLITSYLLLICARDLFKSDAGDADSKYYSRIQDRLYASDNGVDPNVDKPLFTLSKANRNFFSHIITESGPDKVAKLENSHEVKKNNSNKNLLTAYKLLAAKLKETNDARGPAGVNDLIRAMLTNFTVLRYHLKDQSRIYRLFHLLNYRGLPLVPPDLVKNYLFGLINEEGYVDEYDDKWDEINTRITGADKASAKQEQFFHHYLMAVGRYRFDDRPDRIPGRDVYKYFKKLIEDVDEQDSKQQKVKRLIDELSEWSEKFYHLRRPDEFQKEDDVQHYLKKIRAIKAVFLYPILLAGHKAYWERGDKESFEKLVKMCFVYHVRVKAVGTSIGVAEYEARLNRVTDDVNSGMPVSDIIKDLIRDGKYYPSDDKFELNLRDYTVAESGLATALLEEIERTHSRKPSPPSVSLEHIMPRSFAKWFKAGHEGYGGEDREDGLEFHSQYKNKLGNQTLLSIGDNSAAAARPFSEKREIYKAEKSYEITKQLTHHAQWGKAEIDSRDEHFRRILVREVSLEKLL